MKLIFLPVTAIAVLLSGWLVGDGLKHFRTEDRFVSVKGLAEREVKADLAFWPIQFRVSDTNLSQAKQSLEADAAKVRLFLTAQGINAADIMTGRIDVSEQLIRQNYNAPVQGHRYTLSSSLNVRSTDIDTIAQAARNLGDLVDEGVLLGFGNQPQYSFSGLNDIKPAMIGEATASAREAAQKFAADSGATVGPIRRATQGYFSILPRDSIGGAGEKEQIYKRIRVVSHFDFALE